MEKNTNTGPQLHYVLPAETIAGTVPGPAWPGSKDLQQKAEVHHA